MGVERHRKDGTGTRSSCDALTPDRDCLREQHSPLATDSINTTSSQQCFLLNNYNSALAIASGLQGAAIYRLKKTWDGLAQQAISRYEQLVALMSRDGNFHNFREQTRAIRPPFVPYLGVFLTDLVVSIFDTPSHPKSSLRRNNNR